MKNKKLILIISIILIVFALSGLGFILIKDRNKTHESDNICNMNEKC